MNWGEVILVWVLWVVLMNVATYDSGLAATLLLGIPFSMLIAYVLLQAYVSILDQW